MTTVTEAQKKQIMIVLTIFLSFAIFAGGIVPLRSKIELNETELQQYKTQHDEMQSVIENKSIEAEYVKLREEYQTKFQLRFENFESNEKIEAITNEFDKAIKSMTIQDFQPVTTSIYEELIAQPKTEEELELVRIDESSPVFPLLLYSQVTLDLDVRTFEEELMMYDAFNNIVPVGPGDSDPDRFCILISQMQLQYVNPTNQLEDNTNASVPYSVYVFAMETMDLTEWDAEFEARKQGDIS